MRRLFTVKCLVVVAVLASWAFAGYNMAAFSRVEPSLPMMVTGVPKLKHCSCDGSTFCMDDEDYMQLMVFGQQFNQGNDFHR